MCVMHESTDRRPLGNEHVCVWSGVELGSEATAVADLGHGCTSLLLELLRGGDICTQQAKKLMQRHWKTSKVVFFNANMFYLYQTCVSSKIPVDMKSPRHVN